MCIVLENKGFISEYMCGGEGYGLFKRVFIFIGSWKMGRGYFVKEG